LPASRDLSEDKSQIPLR